MKIKAIHNFAHNGEHYAAGETIENIPAHAAKNLVLMGRAQFSDDEDAEPNEDDIEIDRKAKKIADAQGIDISQIVGTGEDGLITVKDIRDAIAQRNRSQGGLTTANAGGIVE